MLPSHHKTTHTKQTFESPPDDKVQQSDNRSRYQNVHLDHSPPSEVPPDVYLMKDAGFRRDGASPGRGFISANRDRLAVPQVDYHPLRARYPPSAPGNPSGGFEFSSVFAEFTRGCANETGDEKEIPSPYDRTKQRRGPPIGGGATIHQQGDQGIFYSSSTSSTSRHPFKPPPGFGAVSPQSVSPQSADRWHNVQFSDPRRNYLANVSYPFGYIDVQWTKIDRNVVSPEALIGRESFYVTSNHVMVFATLTLEEVEDYASVTRTMQGVR
ncbi:hypothetical protein F4677DRAFT_27832 [Hypoxylon crocopeplum]|nr:hypothetical protein F4677DRAFT_27832 [Hypoxylon crocopeplum]